MFQLHDFYCPPLTLKGQDQEKVKRCMTSLSEGYSNAENADVPSLLNLLKEGAEEFIATTDAQRNLESADRVI